MQSRTSFFNLSVFKKSISRFWPVWGAYCAIWLILLPVIILANFQGRNVRLHELTDYLLNVGFYGGLIGSAVFGVFSAMAVWGFAYNTRSTHGIACLPIRREGLFFSCTLAGLLPYLVVNLFIVLLALLAQLLCGVVDAVATMQCFALMSLPFLLFYGFAVFCAQLTGNILVLPAVYAVLNFVCVGVEILCRALANLLVFGLNQDLSALATKWFSPFVALTMHCRVLSDYSWDAMGKYIPGPTYFVGWHLLVIYAVVGLVFLALALLLFRCRKMETAGDTVAIDILKPVFRWCMAIGWALCLSCLMFVIFTEFRALDSGLGTLLLMILFMFIGAVIGWYMAEMLIRKSFRVFRSRPGGLALCCLILLLLCCSMEFDFFGFEKYVPNPDRVESVSVRCSGVEPVFLEEPAGIEMVTAAHESILSNKALHETDDPALPDGTSVTLTYHLRSGRRVSRYYRGLEFDPAHNGDHGDAGLLQAVLNCPEAVADRKKTDIPLTADNIVRATVRSVIPASECAIAAGYASAEEYVLREHCGLSPSELSSLSDQDRNRLIYDAVMSYSFNGYSFSKEYQLALKEDVLVLPVPTTMPMPASTSDLLLAGDDFALGALDLDKVLFRYEWTLTPSQAAELYESCILPDISDSALGRVWIIPDQDYLDTVHNTEIQIEAEGGRESDNSYFYEYFTTTTTVDSFRTNQWLAARGISQYTMSELNMKYDYAG